MALIVCPECGGKVSDKAKVCIHCGYPLEMLGAKNNNVFKIILTGLPEKGNSRWRNNSEYSKAVTVVRKRIKGLRPLEEDELSKIIDNYPALLFDGLSEKNADMLIEQMGIAGVITEKQESDSTLDKKLNIILNIRSCAEVVCPICGCAKIAALPSKYDALGSRSIDVENIINYCQMCGHKWTP